MNAVIYARTVRITNAKKVSKGKSANVWSLPILLALRLSGIILTVRFRQKRITVPNFKK